MVAKLRFSLNGIFVTTLYKKCYYIRNAKTSYILIVVSILRTDPCFVPILLEN